MLCRGTRVVRTAARCGDWAYRDTRETAANDATAIIMMDRFEHIEGIEPVFARRLNQAGILTYADLAAQSPGHVQALVLPDEPQDLQVRDWIAQARALADSDVCHESDNAL